MMLANQEFKKVTSVIDFFPVMQYIIFKIPISMNTGICGHGITILGLLGIVMPAECIDIDTFNNYKLK